MMNKIYFTFLCLYTFPIFIEAQTIPLYQSKFQSNVAYGKNISIVKYNKNTTTDLLTFYDDNTSFIQIFNFSLFVNKHFGFEIYAPFNYSKRTRSRVTLLNNDIEKKYSKDYSYTISTDLDNNSDGVFDGIYNTGGIKFIYRYENNKFSIQPKLIFGITDFYAKKATIFLKSKSSNNSYEINYKTNVVENNYFTPGVAFNIGYKLHKKIGLFFETNYSTFKPNIIFTKEEKDLLLNTSKTEKFIYNKRQHNLSIGIGITYVFKNKK